MLCIVHYPDDTRQRLVEVGKLRREGCSEKQDQNAESHGTPLLSEPNGYMT